MATKFEGLELHAIKLSIEKQIAIEPRQNLPTRFRRSNLRLMMERSSAADKRGLEAPPMAHQMLQFMQPFNSWPWRSISVSGRLHSKQ